MTSWREWAIEHSGIRSSGPIVIHLLPNAMWQADCGSKMAISPHMDAALDELLRMYVLEAAVR
jgi:hypothetical protein